MWLFYRRGGLGDTLLTFPILEILKRSGRSIWAVGNTDYFSLAREVGWVKEISSELPEMEFEARILISSNGSVKPFPERRVWIVEHYLQSLSLKGSFSKVLPLKPAEKSPLEGYAVLHPSSGSWKKIPSLELFLRIERFLKGEGFRTVYLIGEADQWLKSHVRNYFESFSPLEIAKAIKKARLFVGLDSGLSHLASYCGLPTFIFYGPTDTLVWRPIGERIFQISLGLSCSPCFPDTCKDRACLQIELLFNRFMEVYAKHG